MSLLVDVPGIIVSVDSLLKGLSFKSSEGCCCSSSFGLKRLTGLKKLEFVECREVALSPTLVADFDAEAILGRIIYIVYRIEEN